MMYILILVGFVAGIVTAIISLAAVGFRNSDSPYYRFDIDEAARRIEPIESIDDLRIPGLTVDEADEFWHAVNDNPATIDASGYEGCGPVVPGSLQDKVMEADHNDVIEYDGNRYLVVKKIGGSDV